MNNELVRVATELLSHCTSLQPSSCHQGGAPVDKQETHGLQYRESLGCHPRHASINDIIERSLRGTKISSHYESSGLDHDDGKHPDGVTMMPWKSERRGHFHTCSREFRWPFSVATLKLCWNPLIHIAWQHCGSAGLH